MIWFNKMAEHFYSVSGASVGFNLQDGNYVAKVRITQNSGKCQNVKRMMLHSWAHG